MGMGRPDGLKSREKFRKWEEDEQEVVHYWEEQERGHRRGRWSLGNGAKRDNEKMERVRQEKGVSRDVMRRRGERRNWKGAQDWMLEGRWKRRQVGQVRSEYSMREEARGIGVGNGEGNMNWCGEGMISSLKGKKKEVGSEKVTGQVDFYRVIEWASIQLGYGNSYSADVEIKMHKNIAK